MAEPIISRERIRKAAQEAVMKGLLSDACPPEFAPYRHVWTDEFRKAIDDAAIGLALQTR